MISLEYLLGKKLRNLPVYTGAQIPKRFCENPDLFIGELFMFLQNETKSQNFRPQ